MDRNKPCFCGSGRKQKHCHPELEPNSILGSMLKLYQKMDIELKKSNNPSNCHKGCDMCCYDLFQLSQAEFFFALYGAEKQGFSIVDILERGYYLYKILANENQTLINLLDSPLYTNDADAYSTYMETIYMQVCAAKIPCVFLNLTDKSCKIYNYRPSICRYHGVGFIDKFYSETDTVLICDNNPYGILRKNLIDLSQFADEILNLSVYKVPELNISLFDINFPIFQFCKVFYTGEDNYKTKMITMKTDSFPTYAKKMFARNVK